MAIDRWLRRRSLARLGSDADRAEKRALTAIVLASASIGAALEAVRLVAIARELAEKGHDRPMNFDRLSSFHEFIEHFCDAKRSGDPAGRQLGA